MADSPSELQLEIEKLERKHAEHPEGRFFVPLANAYRKMGDIETAEALLRSGVERHPDYLSAHIVLGRCLADRGAVGEAQEEFRFVLSQDPQNLIALRTLGELAVADGRPAEAAEWYRELLAVDPMNEDARQALDSLADVPAAEVEDEFRSGAGWWESAGAEEPASASAEPAETQPLEGLTSTADEVSGSGDEAAAESPGTIDFGDDLALDEADTASSALDGGAADDGYAWGGYDDLPGLRGDEGAATEAEEPARPEAEREPQPFTGFSGAAGGDEDEEGARFGHEGSSEVVTETIAELYARQGLHERAAAVYSELIRRRGGDAALEQRLAEIERIMRGEEEEAEPEAQQPASDLSFTDEEALLSAPIDVEEEEYEDAFAASFAEGFTTVFEEQQGAGIDPSEPHVSFPDEGDAWSDREAGEAVGAGAEGFDEHPLPELAPRSRDEAPEDAAVPAIPSGASIIDFLGGLAAWRPSGAPPAPAGEQPEPVEEQPGAAASWGGAEAPVDTEEATATEGWAEAPAEGDYGVGEGTIEYREAPAAEPSAEAYAEPWDTPPLPGDDTASDLPYLEEPVDSASDGGTGPAEDEPFPWELPGAATAEAEGEEVQPPEDGLDPFFVDDVEPASLRADEPLPEAAPPQEVRNEPEPEPRSTQIDQSEDEDLESFQAWLRSLKR